MLPSNASAGMLQQSPNPSPNPDPNLTLTLTMTLALTLTLTPLHTIEKGHPGTVPDSLGILKEECGKGKGRER